MKNQQAKLASKRNVIRLVALMAMLALMVCGMVFAINAAPVAESVTISADTGITFDAATGRWTKVYDGQTAIDVSKVTVVVDNANAEIISASFDSKNAGQASSITVTYKVDGGSEQKMVLPAAITPIELSWKENGTASVVCNPANDKYVDVAVTLPATALDTAKVIAGEVVTFTAPTVSFTANDLGNSTVYANVVLSGADAGNYVVAPVLVDVTVTPIEITTITWSGAAEYTFGDDAMFNITATGKTAGGEEIALLVTVQVGNEYKSLADAYKAKQYGYVKAGEAATSYTLCATAPNALYVIADSATDSFAVSVAKAIYSVELKDGSFSDGGLLNNGSGFANYLVVEGKNGASIPAWALEKITYKYLDANGAEVSKITAAGTYTVVATLPSLADGEFENAAFDVATLSATLTITSDYMVETLPEKPVEVSFWATAPGIAIIILIVLILLIVIPMVVGFKLIQLEKSSKNPVISVETTGNVPEIEPVVIPDKIEDPDAVVADAIENLVEDITARAEAAEDAPADVDATDAVAEAMDELAEEVAAIDLAAYEAADIADAEEAAGKLADQLVLELMDQVGAEENEADVSEEVKSAVADAMAENFNESADATDAVALITDEEVVEEEPAVEEVVEEEPAVEEVVEEEPVVEEIVEEEPVVEEAVEEPVVEEPVVEEPVVEEPVVEAPVAETEESDDEEEESFGGFGSMPLEYIDAIAEAERYAEMLEQERRGEVQLVTRYRRSYLSRLAQSQGSIQDYYNVIKNLLLSYKGVKSRVSWNFESFNVGRTPLAKFNAKTRTLYVYIALSAEELADTKYNFTDMSAKKKYAAVPVLLKVKGDRKFKHALELITKLCEEKLQLPKKKNFTEEDYRMPFKTTEELVQDGIVKMMVAAIPVAAPAAEEAPVEEPAVEEAVAEEVVAEEAAPEEAVAEEVVAEEAAPEEAVAEEVVAEEAAPEEAVAEEVVAEEAAEETNENA